MGYYLRAFCTSPAVPPLCDVLPGTQEAGGTLTVDPTTPETDWGSDVVGLVYKEGKLPFLVEINREDGRDSLFAEEIAEFTEAVAESGSRRRKEVLQHLEQTQFLVACQLPTSDIDDDGYDAVGAFLTYSVTHSGGMIQADDEGFYRGDRLIVEV